MTSFRYQAVASSGAPVKGVIDAPDRRAALQQLSDRGLFPSLLESCAPSSSGAVAAGNSAAPKAVVVRPERRSAVDAAREAEGESAGWRLGTGIKRRDVTAFTREMGALLGAGIPIPQALDGLGQEEENEALRAVLDRVREDVRTGVSLSAALEKHPRVFNRLYGSMVRVGEEAGVLPKVMNDLADLMEHEDEVRSEVVAAVSYPAFVLGFGICTVTILLTVVLPRLFGMLQEMLNDLPLPTLILLRTSEFIVGHWLLLLVSLVALIVGGVWASRQPQAALFVDRVKLRLPVAGSVFHAAALGRFARTLGTLVKSGVSLLPALKIVESTIGNRLLAGLIAQVSEETRGGDSLATPLRKLGVFPHTVIQMINVGEETGKLDEMLLKVADIEERRMRARIKTLISLLAPALILVVGALVGFMVIALLLPIMRMSRGAH